MWGADAERLLARVVPWPEASSVEDQNDVSGYVNLHWTMPRDGGKPFWVGKPFRTVTEMSGFLRWLLSKGTALDIYFCLSLQRRCRMSKAGKVLADRSAENAMCCKALWLDLDVKEGGYDSVETALAATLAAIEATGIPKPNAAVASGGGVHLYWILAEALLPRDWRPYAEGLKNMAVNHGLHCDTQCTVDIARVLRVPETFNCKTEPRRPVRLLKLADRDIDVADLEPLKKIPGAVSAALHAAYDAPDPALFPKRESIEPMEKASDGLAQHESEIELDFKKIVGTCPLFKEALVTRGESYGQPLWNLTTLASTFFGESGNKIAHGLSEGHPQYTHESTEKLWERKLRERETRGLGWPTCKAFQAAGSKVCSSCAHFSKIKSPLNLGIAVIPQAMPPLVATFQQAVRLELPAGYVLENGLICVLRSKRGASEDDPDGTEAVPLFWNRNIQGQWAQKDPYCLHFMVEVDGGLLRPIQVDADEVRSTSMFSSIMGQGVRPNFAVQENIVRFFVSWLHKLEQARESITSRPFGWVETGTEREDFVFSGWRYKRDGTKIHAGFADKNLHEAYSPKGTRKPWDECMQFVCSQKNPELEVLLASAFAGPLVPFSGENGCMINVWGTSGLGKSTTMDMAAAVWGHPKKSKASLASTDNGLVSKLARIGNLPLFWDEIRDEAQQTSLASVMFYGAQGIEKTRGTPSGETRKIHTFSTMIVACSNYNFMSFLTKKYKADAASLYRVFEYHASMRSSVKGHYDVSAMRDALQFNHGRLAEEYAALLAVNSATLQEWVVEEGKAFDKLVEARQPERYWSKCCACLLVGMKLANKMGCNFDVAANRQFLVSTFLDLRKRVSDEAPEGPEMFEETLTNFLRDHVRDTLITDVMAPIGRALVKVYNPIPPHLAVTNPRKVHVQVARDLKLLRISKSRFEAWCAQRNFPLARMMRGMDETFQCKHFRTTLGAGTSESTGGKERVMEIRFAPGSDLEAAVEMACQQSNLTGGGDDNRQAGEHKDVGRAEGNGSAVPEGERGGLAAAADGAETKGGDTEVRAGT